MKILCVGGGPAGLYFGILMKQRDQPDEVTILERNRPDDTFGFGVVFSERTLEYLQSQDEVVYSQISRNCQTWDPIEVHFKGKTILCGGNGFSAISRKRLLNILQERAIELGVDLRFQSEFDDMSLFKNYDLVVAADGVNSIIRRAFAEHFRPTIEIGKAKYAWFGTTKMFTALTFLFEETEHGIFGVHAYPFDDHTSTFIVETDEGSWRGAGLDRYVESSLAPGMSDLVSMAYCQRLFAGYLDGHELLANNSKWLNFRTVRNETWHYENIVLMGDAAHTAHFSVGSGTKMAMEDAIALSQALDRQRDISAALAQYERVRRPEVERIQRASRPSIAWWEDFRRYKHFAPEQFTFNFLTRNPRMTSAKLKERDSQFVTLVNRWFTREAMPPSTDGQTEMIAPMSAPLRLRDIILPNRIVVSLRPDASIGENSTIGKAGLVILEFQGDRNVTVEQLRRTIHAIHDSSSPKIGLHIRLVLPQQFREMEQAMIRRLIADCANWLRLAEEAKADVIELDLTSPHIPLAVPDAVREMWSAEKPLAVRISTPEAAEEGIDDRLLEMAELLKQHGCDLIGIALGQTTTRNGQLHQRLLSDRIRNEVHLPTMLIGGLANADEIDTVILSARTDLYLLDDVKSLNLAV